MDRYIHIYIDIQEYQAAKISISVWKFIKNTLISLAHSFIHPFSIYSLMFL